MTLPIKTVYGGEVTLADLPYGRRETMLAVKLDSGDTPGSTAEICVVLDQHGLKELGHEILKRLDTSPEWVGLKDAVKAAMREKENEDAARVSSVTHYKRSMNDSTSEALCNFYKPGDQLVSLLANRKRVTCQWCLDRLL